jgi:hypothetical protein
LRRRAPKASAKPYTLTPTPSAGPDAIRGAKASLRDNWGRVDVALQRETHSDTAVPAIQVRRNRTPGHYHRPVAALDPPILADPLQNAAEEEFALAGESRNQHVPHSGLRLIQADLERRSGDRRLGESATRPSGVIRRR